MVILSPLALGAAFASSVIGAPWPTSIKYATHHMRSLPNGVKISTFSPPSQFEVSSVLARHCSCSQGCQTFGAGVDHPLVRRAEPADIEEISVSVVSSRLGVSEDEISFKKSFAGEAATHAYLKQKIVRVSPRNAILWAQDFHRKVSKLRMRLPTLLSIPKNKLSRSEPISSNPVWLYIYPDTGPIT